KWKLFFPLRTANSSILAPVRTLHKNAEPPLKTANRRLLSGLNCTDSTVSPCFPSSHTSSPEPVFHNRAEPDSVVATTSVESPLKSNGRLELSDPLRVAR